MSEMLERVAIAIQMAQEKPKYVVKISKVWECWDVQEDKLIVSSDEHFIISNECDKLNALYTARKAVEALKGEIPSETFFKYRCDKPWKELTSSDVWNLWIDAVLSGD